MAGLLFSACQEDRMEKDGQSFQSGKVTVELLAGRSDVIESRVTDPVTEADQRIENAFIHSFLIRTVIVWQNSGWRWKDIPLRKSFFLLLVSTYMQFVI